MYDFICAFFIAVPSFIMAKSFYLWLCDGYYMFLRVNTYCISTREETRELCIEINDLMKQIVCNDKYSNRFSKTKYKFLKPIKKIVEQILISQTMVSYGVYSTEISQQQAISVLSDIKDILIIYRNRLPDHDQSEFAKMQIQVSALKEAVGSI